MTRSLRPTLIFWTVAWLLCATLAPVAALAAPPATTLVHGVLKTPSGGPVTDGNYTLKFGLYPAKTAPVATWSEGPVLIAVASGLFSYALGTTKPLDPATLAKVDDGWIGVAVAPGPELPRQKLHAVLHARHAGAASSLSCSGCVTANHLAKGVLSAELVGFTYAGSKTKGGPAVSALDVKCTGCIGVDEIAWDKDVDLGGNGLKAKVISAATVNATTVIASSFVGDGSKLSGIKTSAGSCKVEDQVVKGIAADGSLICVPVAAKQAGGSLAAVSNGLLDNVFTDNFASAKPVKIPDNNPIGAGDQIAVADVGLAKSLKIHVKLTNSDIKDITVDLFDPNNKKYVLYAKGGKGATLEGTWPAPNKLISGDLSPWVGKNPKGNWRLVVRDTAFFNNGFDGALQSWSVQIQTLSNKKVAGTGLFEATGGLTLQHADKHPVACSQATIARVYFNSKDEKLYVCNGKEWHAFANTAVPDGSADKPVANCKVLSDGGNKKSGEYWLDPDGDGPQAKFQVWCDLLTDGGGWALLMSSSHGTKWAAGHSIWHNNAVDGFTPTPTAEGKSKAWTTLKGNELLFKTHKEAAGYWASFKLSSAQTILNLVGTGNISGKANGYKDSITHSKVGSKAHGCWKQTWRVSWRNYWSSDKTNDSSIFAPSGANGGRPCGGNGAYATGIGVRTDTINGFGGYGGSFEGYGSDGAGNKGLTSGYVSIYIR